MKWYEKMIEFISLKVVSPINWNGIRALFNRGLYYTLTPEDLENIREKLSKGYYFILTHRDTHLTTYLISLGNFIKTTKWSYWSHLAVNLEGDVSKDADFRIMEATGKGAGYSHFMEVFDVDGACLLMPNLTPEEWEIVMEGEKEQDGKKYDTLFDLADETKVSCVEVGLNALKKLPNYKEKFANLEAMIQKYGQLTPQMYYDCPDFKNVLEVRR